MFTFSELDKALTKLKKSNATGVDEIHNAMLTSLSQSNKKYLLHLFNIIYLNDFVPDSWKKAIIIPLLKPGKPADKATSYRPISLTSCLDKPFERLLTNRLNWFVENKNLLGPEQAGFRKSRCTTDNLVKIDPSRIPRSNPRRKSALEGTHLTRRQQMHPHKKRFLHHCKSLLRPPPIKSLGTLFKV